ncbi:50S ribosome-binding GTPase (macronuclear) [Tetrahymena thermophila SB210]|uniref:50S ribosome-binding GTPase n=1 Tax=Tetrahymena thermophila (strain SB210) TaxID=312017 RepID=Q23BU0_TETTS|nr:50S ribosome-binding GTPase [Tetrahymena thermophila SB210]EAR94028.2 50S ribosome-binding GTPase [Tetrahymena thermophila SB210]|eukprot:XP_001014273.2 50S ribosome-binding GTPase [Tetrahymena thermophila SB210]
MSLLNPLLQSSVQDDPSFWLSSVVLSSQASYNSSYIEQNVFKTCFKPEEMLNQIEEKSILFGYAKNKDAILVLGSTGSGKSTTINFLMKKKMVLKLTSITHYIEDVGEIEVEEEQICTENNDGDDEEFKIGFKKESQTLILKAKQLEDSDFFICDTPGFKDSRGFEVELSNSICLINFIKQCKSICPILTINYNDLKSVRGASFKDILVSFSKFIETASMDKIRESLEQNSTPELKVLLISLVNGFNSKKAFILNPVEEDPKSYLPSSKFNINLSEDSLTKLKLYSEDVLSYVTKCTQQGFHIEKLIDVLDQYAMIKNITMVQNMIEKYDQCIQRVLNYAASTKRIAFKNLNQSKNLQQEINQRYINQIVICLEQTLKIDSYKNPHFQKYEFTYNSIIDEIKIVIQQLCYEITACFQNQIENINIQLIKSNIIKIEQLSNISQELHRFSYEIKHYTNQQFSNYEKEQSQFLEQSLTKESEIPVFEEKLAKIVQTFKQFNEIDTQLDIILLDSSKQQLLNKTMQKLNKYNQFLSDVSWIDEKLKTKCVQQTKDSMKKWVNKYFNYCIQGCDQSVYDQNFKYLDSFMVCFSKLKEIKGMIDNFKQIVDKCINNIYNQIVSYIYPIQSMIKQIITSKELPELSQLQDIEKYLIYKSKILKMINPYISVKQMDSINKEEDEMFENLINGKLSRENEIIIENDFEDFFRETFKKFQNLFKELSYFKLQKMVQKQNQEKEIIKWKNFTKIINQCQKECKQIMLIIGGGDSFNDIVQSISNTFYKLQDEYKDIKSNSEYLIDITQKYQLLEEFVDAFSNLEPLSNMRNQLITTQNPRQLIKITVENLQKEIKHNRFTEVKIFIEQLNKLSDEYSKDKLSKCREQLEQYQQEIINEINILVEQKTHNDDPIKETYKEVFIINFYRLVEYAKTELFEISEELQNNKDQIQLKVINLRLNKLEYISQKIEQYIQKLLSSEEYVKQKNQLEVQIKYLIQEIEENISKLEQIQKESNNYRPLSSFKSSENFEETIQRLNLLKEQDIQQYKKEVEVIETKVMYQLVDLINSFLNLNQEIRKSQVKQIIYYLKFKLYFSNKAKQEIDNALQDLENKINNFFNQQQIEFQKVETVSNLIAYHDLIELINQKSQNSKSYQFIEEKYQQQLNIAQLKNIYQFTIKNNPFIEFYKKQSYLFQVGDEKVVLNILDLELIEKAIISSVTSIKEQIKISFHQKNFNQLKENLQVLDKNQDTTFQGLDISEQLENIYNHLQIYIEPIITNVVYNSTDLDKETILNKITKQLPKLEGKTQDLISLIISQYISFLS